MDKEIKEGIYEEIITTKLRKLIDFSKDSYYFDEEKMNHNDSRVYISKYIKLVSEKALKLMRDGFKDDKEGNKAYLMKQVEVCNEIIDVLKKNLKDEEFEGLKIDDSEAILKLVKSKSNIIEFHPEKISRPETSISGTSIFTGNSNEPSMISEINNEILSCDEVWMLVSFIKHSGLIKMYDHLKEITEQGKKVKIITTTYMQATDFQAIEMLSKLNNVEIKISYDSKLTRLHAKSYIFKRNNGFTTAYVGSSNISNPALTVGTEWNVKLSERDSFEIIQKITSTFETYWNDSKFQDYFDTEECKAKLHDALKKERNDSLNSSIIDLIDIKPYYYQEEILEELQAQREIHNNNRNLVIAATGVGKTVIAAFDYKRFRENNERARLLFIAHRKEILEKSRETFRIICKDGNLGELLVDGIIPEKNDVVFASIQSFNSKDLINKFDKDYFDFIIIDEVHHAAADSYKNLLEYFKPKILLGLTATPERQDCKDIAKYFNNTFSAEMRLQEAIDAELLVPFQYYAVSDSISLENLKWSKNHYEISELEKAYTDISDFKAQKRVDEIVAAIRKYTILDNVCGLGFCVSKKHAEFMANKFNEKGISSTFLTSDSESDVRSSVRDKLVKGEYRFIFCVDLFNEGVDIPELNTVLFLRPTESSTVFLQQLGRGLRLSYGKDSLTVLDFVGQAHKEFNFAPKYSALMGETNNKKQSVKDAIENGFSYLPKGCYVHLEKQAKEYVLRNFTNVSYNEKILTGYVEAMKKDFTLEEFLSTYDLDINKFYTNKRSLTKLMNKVDSKIEYDEKLDSFADRIKKILSTSSPKFLLFMKDVLENFDKYCDLGKNDYEEKEEIDLMLWMMTYTFHADKISKSGYTNQLDALQILIKNECFKKELIQVIDYQYNRLNHVMAENTLNFVCPLEVHARYDKSQILSALGLTGIDEKPFLMTGVKYIKDKKVDVFFVTLDKTKGKFTTSTSYEDYAINSKKFRWQSQNFTKPEDSTGRRYINHVELGSQISLFVQETKDTPYLYLGECIYNSHDGSKPISFVWDMVYDMPADFVKKSNDLIV